jgi:hypothetical protein
MGSVEGGLWEMTDDEIPRDISLWKCTIKKSKHVSLQVFKYIYWSVICCIIGGGVIAGLYIIYLASIKLSSLWSILSNTFFGAIGLFYLIPWWVYVIIAVIAAIPIYSFLWCLNRDITEDDKKIDRNDPMAMKYILSGAVVGGLIGVYKGLMISTSLSSQIHPSLYGLTVFMGSIFFGLCFGLIGLIISAGLTNVGMILLKYNRRKKSVLNTTMSKI